MPYHRRDCFSGFCPQSQFNQTANKRFIGYYSAIAYTGVSFKTLFPSNRCFNLTVYIIDGSSISNWPMKKGSKVSTREIAIKMRQDDWSDLSRRRQLMLNQVQSSPPPLPPPTITISLSGKNTNKKRRSFLWHCNRIICEIESKKAEKSFLPRSYVICVRRWKQSV